MKKIAIISKTHRYCGLHREDKQRLSYATHLPEADVSLLRLARKLHASENPSLRTDVLSGKIQTAINVKACKRYARGDLKHQKSQVRASEMATRNI